MQFFTAALAVAASLATAIACNDFCIDQLAPVCGQLTPTAAGLTVYREFSNSCQLDVANCRAGSGPKYVQRGTRGCAAQGLRSRCEATCPAVWQPVCASRQVNGSEERRTFGNGCSVDVENCKEAQNPFEVIDNKEC